MYHTSTINHLTPSLTAEPFMPAADLKKNESFINRILTNFTQISGTFKKDGHLFFHLKFILAHLIKNWLSYDFLKFC